METRVKATETRAMEVRARATEARVMEVRVRATEEATATTATTKATAKADTGISLLGGMKYDVRSTKYRVEGVFNCFIKCIVSK